MVSSEYWWSLNKRLKKVPGDKRSMGIAESVNQLLELLLPSMSTMPSQSSMFSNAPFIENPELFQEDLDVEDDLEKIQWEVDSISWW